MRTRFLSALLTVATGAVYGQVTSQTGAATSDLAQQRFATADVHRTAPGTAMKRLYIASVLLVAGANALDVYSSYGKREINPLLQGSNGTFNATSVLTKTGLVLGFEVPQIFLIRHAPGRMRVLAMTNFTMGAVLMGISAHNFGVPGPRQTTAPSAAAAMSIAHGSHR